MQIFRTVVWVLILFGMLAFSFFNWKEVEVNLWENLILETKVPVLVIIAFLLGLLPMWLYHRSVKWSLGRRIRSLEASIKSNALSQRHEPAAGAAVPAATDQPVENIADNPAKAEDSLSLEKPSEGGAPA